MEYIRKAKPYIITAVSVGAIMLYEGIRVTNSFSLLIVVGIFLLFTKTPNFEGKREKVIACLVATIIDSFLFLHGTQVLHTYELTVVEKILALLIMMIGAFFVIEKVLEIVYIFAANTSVLGSSTTHKWPGYWQGVVVILVCWLPFYLWSFPGIVTSDSTTQIIQAINHNYSNHHPVLQTWVIQGVMAITSAFSDSLNTAVAFYIILQCIVLALIYAYVVSTLCDYKVKPIICYAVLLYFAIMPYNVMMSLNMWKDTLFSGGFLLFIICTWRIIQGSKGKDLLLLFLGGIILCMLRNNGWYAFIVSIPVIAVFFWKKRKDACFVLIAILISAAILRGPIFKKFNVLGPNIVESLSIPMQQIANVISNDKELTKEEEEIISAVVDIDKIKETYDCRYADYIKNLVLSKGNTDAIVNDKAGFFKAWLQIGLRNPGLYLQAFVNQTEGYYNPDIQRWQYTQGVWNTQMPIYSRSLLPEGIGAIFKWYVSDWLYRVPVIGIIKSIGFFVWIMFALLGLCIIKRKYSPVVLFVPLVIYWGTIVVATPVYAEFRYIYPLFVTMPVLILSIFLADQTEKSREHKELDAKQ